MSVVIAEAPSPVFNRHRPRMNHLNTPNRQMFKNRIMCDEANIKTQHRLKLQSALKKLPMSMISQQRIPSPINRKVMSDDGVADTADETRTWLHENGLSCITDKCLKNEMTLEILMEATITDIKIMCDEANIKTQHRLKLQSALKKLPMSMISQQRNSISSINIPTNIQENKETELHKFAYPIDRNSTQYDHLFKLLLIGDPGVGKSSILLRFADDNFMDNYINTIGVDFRVKTLTVDEKLVKLQIWDTAGCERFRTIQSAYYRGAHAIIVVYDITNEQTFDDVKQWLFEIDRYANDEVVIFIVGTKVDLQNERIVNFDKGNSFAKEYGFKFCEVSAKSGENIRQLFNSVSLYCLMKFPVHKRHSRDTVDLNTAFIVKEKHNKKKCCV
eukprot:60660_1